MTRAGARFSRAEPRRRARAFVLGLLAELPRKNCWTIAEHAGDRTPDGMQHLLSRARWDAGGVRDDVRSYVVEQLGDPGAVLVADETGDVKKGTATPGVQRQYTGTAGRIENAQVAVYLGYAAPRGHALIDRALYLPKSWTGDPARCEAITDPTPPNINAFLTLAQQRASGPAYPSLTDEPDVAVLAARLARPPSASPQRHLRSHEQPGDHEANARLAPQPP